MKKIFLSILVFFFNIVPIYALSFKMEPSFNSMIVSDGDTVKVDVYLNDILDTASGISACALKITADDGIKINDEIKTYGNWQGMRGSKGYSFDTTDVVLTNTKIFTISVTVNQSGSVKLTDIVCTDIDDVQNNADNKVITFAIENKASSSSQASSSAKPSSSVNSKPSSSSQASSSKQPAASSSSKPSVSNQSSSSQSSSSLTNNETNVYLKDLIVTGGIINFNKEIFEYNIIVDDYDNVSVKCVVELEGSDTCSVSESLEEDLKNFVVTVWNKDGKSQKYILYMTKNLLPESSSGNTINPIVTEKKDYSFIFIVIIIILVLVNVGRICYNYSRNKKK